MDLDYRQVLTYAVIGTVLLGLGFLAQGQLFSVTSGVTQIESVWSASVDDSTIFESESVTLTIETGNSFNGYKIVSDTGQQIAVYGGGEPAFIQETPWNMPSTYQTTLEGSELEPGQHTYYVKSLYCSEYVFSINKYRCDDMEFYDTVEITVDVRNDGDNDGVFDRNDDCLERSGAKANGCPNFRQQVNRLVGDFVSGVTGFFNSLV